MFHENLSLDKLIDFENIASHFGEQISFTDLMIYSIGMVIYGIFIWHFYRYIATREMIPLGLTKYQTDGKKATSIAVYIIKYIIVFPLVVLIWFVVYSSFLFFMAPNLSIDLVFLVVISLVVAVRISAYYKEDLAKDFAKLIPFALLGIFLTNTAFFTLEQVGDKLETFIPFLGKIVGFIVYAIIIEGILRVLFLIKRKIRPVADEKLEQQIENQIDEKIKVSVEKIEKKQEEIKEKIENNTDELHKKIDTETNDLEDKIKEKTDDKKQ